MENKPLIIGTGLSGMVGSRLVELLSENYDFQNLDLTQGVDITNQAQVDRALSSHRPSAVIHLAAFTDVSKAHQQTGDKKGSVYMVNVLGTQNIAKSCFKHKHYLIHISTDYVFNGRKSTAYTETDKTQPIEWYGKTKLWAEKAVVESGCKNVIVRIAFPFRSGYPQKLDLVRNIIAKLKTDSLHPMFNDQIITPTFVDDICKVLGLFVRHQPSGIYHVVGSTPVSPLALAQKISTVFNLKAGIKSASFKDYLIKDPRPRPQYLNISNQKLKKDFNLSMSSLNKALETLQSQL